MAGSGCGQVNRSEHTIHILIQISDGIGLLDLLREGLTRVPHILLRGHGIHEVRLRARYSQFVLGVVEGPQRVLDRAWGFRRQQFVHILLFLSKVRAYPFFRSGAIQFPDPDVKRIALSKATRPHGNQEQANPQGSQKRAANRPGTARIRHGNLRNEVIARETAIGK